MSNAGLDGTIEVATSASGPWSSVTGCDSVTVTRQREVVEVTDFDDTSKDRILTLIDVPFGLSGTRPAASDTAWGIIEAGWLAGSSVFIRRLFDGTNGFHVECLIASIEESAAPGDRVAFSVDAQSKGSPVAVP